MHVSRLDTGRRQLESAIRMFFLNDNPVAIHTLHNAKLGAAVTSGSHCSTTTAHVRGRGGKAGEAPGPSQYDVGSGALADRDGHHCVSNRSSSAASEPGSGGLGSATVLGAVTPASFRS